MRHGSREERLEALSQSVPRQHSRHYEAGHSASRASRRHTTHQRLHLQGNTRRLEGVPRERYPRRGDVHGAREAQNGHVNKRRVRAETFRS